MTGWAFGSLIRPRSPTGVRHDGDPGGREGEGAPQVVVGLDRTPETTDVVTQPPDQDGGLVDEREAPGERLDRPVAEEPVLPIGRCGDGGELSRVRSHEHVDAGRVAAANLEAAE